MPSIVFAAIGGPLSSPTVRLPVAQDFNPVSEGDQTGDETSISEPLLIDQPAFTEERLERLGILVSSFLNPDSSVPQSIPDGGQLFFSWQYWMTWKLGEKTNGISKTEVEDRRDEMIADLKVQYGDFEISKDMRRDLEYMARRDIATDMMIDTLRKKTGSDAISPGDIVAYLAGNYNNGRAFYTDSDIEELESLFKFFYAISEPLNLLIDSDLHAFYASDAGLITGTVLGLREELEEKYGKNFIITGLPDDLISQAIQEEFDLLIALKPHVEDILGREINFFHPNGGDFGYLRAWAARIEGGLKNPPSGAWHAPVWESLSGNLREKAMLDHVLNVVIPRTKLLKSLQERAFGHVFDLINDQDDINLIAHWSKCIEDFGWSEYEVMERLTPNWLKMAFGYVGGLFGGFNWDNRVIRIDPVDFQYLSESEEPLNNIADGVVNTISIPQDNSDWRSYGYLNLHINTIDSDADSLVVRVNGSNGDVAEYVVDIAGLPQGESVAVRIPLRRYIVDDNGDGVRDIIAWDGFIGHDGWKEHVTTDLDRDLDMIGITDFSNISSLDLQSIGGRVIINIGS